MSHNHEKLEAHVAAVNEANHIANGLYATLAPIFAPLVGKKIVINGGGFTARVKELLPDLPNSPNLHIHPNRSDYSLSFSVRVSKPTLSSCIYHETSAYIGEMHNGFLTKINDKPYRLKTDYDAAEVERLREDYRRKKAEADEAQSALHPFGEYDR